MKTGKYEPQPVLRVGILKPDGSLTNSGIPRACDRVVQQALLNIPQPIFVRELTPRNHGRNVKEMAKQLNPS